MDLNGNFQQVPCREKLRKMAGNMRRLRETGRFPANKSKLAEKLFSSQKRSISARDAAILPGNS
jgi:hypothetical protein